MSSEDLKTQVEQLRGLVASLGLQVARLDSELEEVRDRCYKVEGDLADYKLQREFELVEPTFEPTSSTTPLSSGLGGAGVPTSSTTPLSSGSGIAAAASGISTERIEIARSVGAWISRCLQDLPRGNSGRNKIKEGSNLYLVVRSIDEVEFKPPKGHLQLQGHQGLGLSWLQLPQLHLRGSSY